jgi:hypothetical protein
MDAPLYCGNKSCTRQCQFCFDEEVHAGVAPPGGRNIFDPKPKPVFNHAHHKENLMSSKSLNLNGMFNAEALMRRFFRRADNVVWDMTTGKPGVATPEGIASCSGTGDDAQITINPIAAMGMALPAFAQNTALDKVELGDMIIYGAKDQTGWVTAKTEHRLSLIKPDGTHTQISPPKTQMLDVGGGVMVVRSLMNMLPGGTGGLNGLMGTMMMLQMAGGGDSDIEEMLPMMLMMQGAGATSGDPAAAAAGNPMAGMQQMLPLMMMTKMMGKNKGGNGGFFGGHNEDGPRFRG